MINLSVSKHLFINMPSSFNQEAFTFV